MRTVTGGGRHRRMILVIGATTAMALASCGRMADPARTDATTTAPPAPSTSTAPADPGAGAPTVVDDQLRELETTLDQIESDLREDESSAANE